MAKFILSRTQAEDEVGDLGATLDICIRTAFSDWRMLLEKEGPLMIGVDATTQANYVSGRIRYYLSMSVDGVKSVTFERSPRQSTLLINGRMRARVKKLDKYGRPRFGRTQAASDFINQQQEFDFPGEERRITNCIIGYKLNPAGTEIEYIRCSCPMGTTNLWSFDIDSAKLRRIEQTDTTESSGGSVVIRPKAKKAQNKEQ